MAVPQTWELPEAFRKRLGTTVGRQRAMESAGQLLLVLHAPPDADEVMRRGRLFWRKDDNSWLAAGEKGAGRLTLASHLDEYQQRLDRIETDVQKATTAREYFDALEKLTPLHRSAKNQHHVLQDARKMCPEVRDLIDLRDRAYQIERTAELSLQETRHLLDLAIARKAEEEAAASKRIEASAHRLNILAAWFFPVVTVSALLGIDLETASAVAGRDLRPVAPYLFGSLLLGGLIVGGILSTVVTQRHR